MSDRLSTALAAVREAERRLVAGEIPRCQFDAVAGSNAAVIAEAAEQAVRLRETFDSLGIAAVSAANDLQHVGTVDHARSIGARLREALESKSGDD